MIFQRFLYHPSGDGKMRRLLLSNFPDINHIGGFSPQFLQEFFLDILLMSVCQLLFDSYFSFPVSLRLYWRYYVHEIS